MNTKRGTANATCLFMLILVLMTALLPCKAFADEALGDVDTPQAPKTTNSQAAAGSLAAKPLSTPTWFRWFRPSPCSSWLLQALRASALRWRWALRATSL